MVEFKRPGEAPRPGQAAVHRKLKKIGHHVYHVDSFSDFVRLLDWMNTRRVIDIDGACPDYILRMRSGN